VDANAGHGQHEEERRIDPVPRPHPAIVEMILPHREPRRGSAPIDQRAKRGVRGDPGQRQQRDADEDAVHEPIAHGALHVGVAKEDVVCDPGLAVGLSEELGGHR
jgi:hypothetical protein